jgi:aspartyl-tRNA(Asn)/glutamyl-tRNA(Gln) amidotransferase subunit A
MIVKVGLGVRFNIHNLTNQRYFVAANAAGAFSTGPPPAVWAEPVEDPTVRDLVLAACSSAGLSLNNSQIDLICAAAPYVMAMTRRLRRERDFREEPANIFRFPE